MEKRKSRPVVFMPVVEWVVFALALLLTGYIEVESYARDSRVYRRPNDSPARVEAEERFIREVHRFPIEWGPKQRRVLAVVLFVSGLICPPVLVVGRKRLWIVRAFGLYVRRIPAENIHSLTLQWMPVWKTDRVILMTEAGDIFEFMHLFRTRRIAEAIHERFGVKLHREDALGSLARGNRFHNPNA